MWVHVLDIGSRHVEDLGRGLGHPRIAIGHVLGHSSSSGQGTSSHVGIVSCRFHILHPPHLQAGEGVQDTGLVTGGHGFAEADQESAAMMLLELWLA